jgi:hypothetical protein
MASSLRRHTSGLRVPGTGSEALRNIGRIWQVQNVADAIPEHLHPKLNPQANNWHPDFQAKLEKLARSAEHHTLSEIREALQNVVNVRCHKRPKRMKYLTVPDLGNVRRIICNSPECKARKLRVEEENAMRLANEQAERDEMGAAGAAINAQAARSTLEQT